MALSIRLGMSLLGFILLALATLAQEPAPSSAEQAGVTGQGKRMIRAIKIIGSISFPPGVLESKLKIVRPDAWVYPEMAEYDIEMNLKGFLKEQGFLQSEIQWNLVPLEGRDVELHLKITEGPQYRLANMVIKGVMAFAPEEISSQFKPKAGDILNFTELKNALETIKNIYADRGFIDLYYLPEMNFDPPNRVVTITFTFQEGMQYRLAYIAFVGCSDQTQEDYLRAQVDIHPGDVYSAGKEKAVFAELKKFGITKDTVDVVDKGRGLIGISYWLKSPQQPSQ